MPSELRVDKVSSTTSPYTPVFSTTGGALSHRNMVVNGDMRIAQRGTSAVTANGEFPVDRFRTDFSNDGSFSLQQVSESPANFQHSIKWTVTGTDTALASTQVAYIRTILEGQDIAHLNWGSSDARTVTLSFYIKSSVTGTFGGAIWNSDFDRSYPFSYTVSSTNWERKSITIPGDTTGTWLTTNGRGINVAVLASAGTTYSASAGSWGAGGKVTSTGATNIMATNSATYHITGVQLELGTVATPFEHRSFADELARCQRYYYVYGDASIDADQNLGVGYGFSTTQLEAIVRFPVEMNHGPDLINSSGTNHFQFYSSGQDIGVNFLSVYKSTKQSILLYKNSVTCTQGRAYRFHINHASAYLHFEAEL